MSHFFYLHRLADQILTKIHFPKFDSHVTSYRTPLNAKIVLLNHKSPLIQNLLFKQFEKFNKFSIAEYLQASASEAAQDPKVLVTYLSDHLNKADSQHEAGYVLVDFPKTSTQAQELEEAVDGVNLAIKFEIAPELRKNSAEKYLNCTSCGKVFNLASKFSSPNEPGFEKSICTESKCNLVSVDKAVIDEDENTKELEDFYEKRGLLLRFRLCPKKAAHEFEEVCQKLADAIEKSIKL